MFSYSVHFKNLTMHDTDQLCQRRTVCLRPCDQQQKPELTCAISSLEFHFTARRILGRISGILRQSCLKKNCSTLSDSDMSATWQRDASRVPPKFHMMVYTPTCASIGSLSPAQWSQRAGLCYTPGEAARCRCQSGGCRAPVCYSVIPY